MHAIEKILAKKAGKASVHAGEIVNCDVDIAGINDLYYQTVKSFYEMGGEKVFDPEKVILFFDHYAPCATEKQADNHKKFRQFTNEQGIPHLMDINEGVCHQLMADYGFSRPGRIIVITDSHTTTHGAFGAFCLRQGRHLICHRQTESGLWCLQSRGICRSCHKTIQPFGPAIKQFSLSERMAMCNMSTEMGAKTSYIQPDEVTMAYLAEHNITDYTIYETDPDYVYDADLTFDVTEIGPQLAAPFSVDNVDDLTAFAGLHVDQCYLGSCTGGRTEDFAVAAKILKGKHIAYGTRMILVPGSRFVLQECLEKGYIQTLMEAGATLTAPGCAACLGIHQGLLAEDEVCVSSTNRNFPGRMGHVKGRIYLGSPASVAAAALNGIVTDPRPYLEGGNGK